MSKKYTSSLNFGVESRNLLKTKKKPRILHRQFFCRCIYMNVQYIKKRKEK